MARPNKPDTPLKCTKKMRLGIYHILARLHLPKIETMAQPNLPDMPLFWGDAVEPKYPWQDQTSQVYQKSAIRYLRYPNSAQNPMISWDIMSVT